MSEIAKTACKGTVSQIQPVNLADQVREELLRLILANAFEPGQRLLEAELARELGVSRGPVREAARQLEKRGLLRFEPRRGFFVKRLEIEDIEALYQFRECLQVYVARVAAVRAKDSDIHDLEQRFEKVLACDGADVIVVLNAMFDFHRLMFQLTGNGRFIETFDDLAWESRQVHAAVNARVQPTSPIDFFRQFALPIVTAMRNRDAAAAERAVREYLHASLEDMKRVLSEAAATERRARSRGPA